MSKKHIIAYLTLQSIHESTACNVHVSEIVSALRQRNLNVDLYCLPDSKKGGMYRKALKFFSVQFKLIRDLKKYDLLYIRAHPMSFPASLFAKLWSVPVVKEINGPYEDVFIVYPWLNFFKYPLIFLQRLQYKYASHLIPVTENLAQWLKQQTNHNRITAISNGANIDLFHPGAGKPAQPIESKYVIFYGSMAKWHDLETAIEAASDPVWPEDTKLVLLGRGDLQKLNEIVKNNPRVLYLGPKDYKQIPNYLSQALAGLVLMNDVEGRAQTGLSPLKLYETLACGVPVIVSDYPGQSDMVRDHKCGIVIPPKSSHELAKAVNYLSTNMTVSKELGDNGRKVLETDYSWWKISEKIHKILVASIEESKRSSC